MCDNKPIPIHTAIQEYGDDVRIVKILLDVDAGRSINARNSKGETPLHSAIRNKKCSSQVIDLLLRYGADVNAASSLNGNTALHFAAMHCSVQISEGYEAPLIQPDGTMNSNRPIKVEEDYSPTIDVLLKYSADVNVRNFEGNTPLHSYLQNKGSRLIHIEKFLKKTRNLNAINGNGDTPLHLVVGDTRCSVWAVKTLLDYGADVSVTDALGNNALEAYRRAVEKNGHTLDLMVLKLLQSNEQQVDSSLHVASLYHRTDAVHKLLNFCADVNDTDMFGYPPLFYAMIMVGEVTSKCMTVKLLLDYGAIVSPKIVYLLHGSNFRVLPLWGSWHRSFQADLYSALSVLDVFMQHLAKFLRLQKERLKRGFNAQLFSRESRDHLMMYLNQLVDLGNSGVVNKYNICSRRCLWELHEMSKTNVSPRVSFLDLLFSNEKQTAIYTKNVELVKGFHAKKVKFTLYRGMLDAKFEREFERRRIAEKAATLLCDILQFAEPSDEFFEKTLSYCRNEDLVHLIGEKDIIEEEI